MEETNLSGAIKGEDLTDVLCMVVRYSGGIKLGAGGLIRAYGGAARMVLQPAPKQVVIPMSSLMVVVPSASLIGVVYDTLQQWGASEGAVDYKENGSVQLLMTCETSNVQSVQDALMDATRGTVSFLNEDGESL
mmetsp:Transcript_31838/g.48726  ORF Transcript_31838/g.48726 Transcript_31838/m.48726 type:complete len:134 (-) Transcript_31838:360-761(-)